MNLYGKISFFYFVAYFKSLVSIFIGAKVDQEDEDDYTALVWASSNGHLDVVKALIAAGEIKNQHYTDNILLKWSHSQPIMIQIA